MIQQLVLSKRMFIAGSEYANSNDPISSGMAISMFQDAVEIFLWTLLKELDANINDNTPFTKYFELVNEAPKNERGKQLPFKAKILELNKARINFKHYGNLPDVSESKKFCDYTEEFLRFSMDMYFGINFDHLSMVEIVPYEDVRIHLKSAEKLLDEDNIVECYTEIAKARKLLFKRFSNIIPEIDRNLADGDRLLAGIDRGQHVHIFRYLSEVLNRIRDLSLSSVCNIPLRTYLNFDINLPVVSQAQAGNWYVYNKGDGSYNKDNAKEMISNITDISVKIYNILHRTT